MSDPVSDDNAPFAGRSALVIDDNAFMRRLVRSLLHQFGFSLIREAADGSEGLRVVTERGFDVVICDWMMEPTDGFAFLQKLRHHRDASVRALPVIMLTSVSTQAEVVAARDAGVTEYLVKPISSGKLRDRLLAVFRQPRTFVVTATYVGPDRRRRQSPGHNRPHRRITDQIAASSDGAVEDWAGMETEYVDVLREEIAHLRAGLAAVRASGATAIEPWRTVHRVAHDIKGHAPTFGYTVTAAIAQSLERLLRPAIDDPATLTRGTDRRVRAAGTHLEALSLTLDQGITGRTQETDALVDRLGRTVERVHREANGD